MLSRVYINSGQVFISRFYFYFFKEGNAIDDNSTPYLWPAK